MNQTLKAPAESKLPDQPAAGWNSLTYPAGNGTRLLYQLYIPEDFDPARRYPLILYMHSAGVRCDDNSHIYTGEAKFLRNLERGAYRENVIVLAPCFVLIVAISFAKARKIPLISIPLWS